MVGEFFGAVAVAVTAALVERLVIHLLRALWSVFRPATPA